MKTFIRLFILTMTTLLFAKNSLALAAPITFAWFNNTQEIEIITDSPGNISTQDIKLLDSSNKFYSFEVSRKTSDSVVLRVTEAINLKKNYIVKTATQEMYVYYSMGFIEANFNYRGPLGVKLEEDKKKATFRLWSPTAQRVSLVVTSPVTNKVIFTTDLDSKAFGLWEIVLRDPKSLEGLHYQYKIKAFGKDFVALDPYAKSMAAFDPRKSEEVGQGVVILDPEARPYAPLLNRKDDVNFIGLEVHVRDATIGPDSPAKDSEKGTFLGLVSALDYYKALGVTHLQLLPLQNFYTVNETQKSYQGPVTPISDINYNWGYDTHNYFTPEGWFSSNPADPYARILELQKMNDEIHKRGMGVILDVVYNHVFYGEGFEASAPGMYLRRNRKGEVSFGTGAGATLESRSVMVRRLIVDSLKYWQDTYHVDGFRFDLMGFLDRETLRVIRESLHPDTILYGEAWVFTDIPHNEAVIKTDLPHSLNISAFNDTSRDSYAGRNEGRGFVQGSFQDNGKVRAGIIGGIKNHPQGHLINQSPYDSFTESPAEALNYLTIHDGFTLWDKINLSIGGDVLKRMQIVKNAYTLLFTSQGRTVLHLGCESGRSKPLYKNDPNPDRAHTSAIAQAENGIRYFHENSYASPDATNAFNWTRAEEFEGLKQYVQGLISIKKSLVGLRLTESDSIRRGVRFIEHPSAGVMAYLIDNKIEKDTTSFPQIAADTILVIHNAEESKKDVMVPGFGDGKGWQVLADCHKAGITPFKSSRVMLQAGGVSIEGKCSAIIVKGIE